jgi:hypothetical protein
MRAVELLPTWICWTGPRQKPGGVCWPRDNSGQLGPGGLNRWGETSKRAKCPPLRPAVYARGPAADGSGLCSFAGAPYGGSGSALRFVGVGCAQVRSGRGGPRGHGRGCWFRCGSELRPVIRRPAAEDRRLGLLEEIFDPVSRRRRSGVQAGWRCLEVGAGRGSMAVWLAERVGPSGGVVATDIDVSYLERLDARNLEVRRHNILEDSLDALAGVVRRCLLAPDAVSPGRPSGAGATANDVVPEAGGLLIDEDADWGTTGPVDPSHPLFSSAAAWRTSIMRRAPRWCAADHRGRGGTARASTSSPRPREASPRNKDASTMVITSALADPSVWFLRELLHACSGRRPG